MPSVEYLKAEDVRRIFRVRGEKDALNFLDVDVFGTG